MNTKRQTKWFLIPYAAMALTMGSALVSFAATGWAEENGEWVYYNNDGSKATDVFKKSGNNWFYLDSDGIMAKNQLIEDDDNYFYVNSAGAMVTNQWRSIENEDSGSDEPDEWWYYFQSNGKAVKKSGSSDNVKFVTLPTSTGQAKFTFDDEGHMLYGWIDESGEMLTDDDAWKSGMYYCSDNGDGRMATGWKYIPAVNDEDDDREGDGYWFYFSTNGKKTVDNDSKKINGQYYGFDVNGKMLQGLYRIEFEANGKTIRSAEEIEDVDEIPDEDEDGVFVYYFGDSPKEGAMKTGTMTLEIDGDKYYYSFEKSGSKKGAGTDGIDGDSIYVKGRRLEAEEGTKYQPVTYKDETYLISTSGKLVKYKKNVKDSDDVYYKTDSKGRIVDSGTEKLD
ncbi:MAG: cell wall-binding protein [Enterocloster clostridioformis]|nr:cell wall-binding protein [Enterocloster clostridioformis]